MWHRVLRGTVEKWAIAFLFQHCSSTVPATALSYNNSMRAYPCRCLISKNSAKHSQTTHGMSYDLLSLRVSRIYGLITESKTISQQTIWLVVGPTTGSLQLPMPNKLFIKFHFTPKRNQSACSCCGNRKAAHTKWAVVVSAILHLVCCAYF